ncbi:pyrroline-5-carboxylate reductase [Salipaludibacillus neizhouensis]|uniref:Pyrroline-5-carboxylate reductase n=1 Tax=Salipaludibacillus neizhouensis TaxID=885475 RepID=A0A3A9K112_9BACI|nr:pyrroline-5-carboxylate reductase [Salipaludibacillus neizhouensis]RKL66794.1 pyrroline-5-carboxylate reductase [Salipaludibacillus neizhouensis]
MTRSKLLMVGAGRMAEAILSGIVKNKKNSFEIITVTNSTDKKKLEQLKHKYSIQASGDWESQLASHDIILLATPPHTHEDILKKLASKIDGQLIITVAAGIDPSFMEERLPRGTPVCWIMPNTAAQVGQSMSTYSCGKYVDKSHRKILSEILSSIGVSEEFSEQHVHDLTAITGSSPAFVYAFVEALEESAIGYGVSSEQARKLVVNMFKGSIAMLEEGHDLKDLIQQVASPGGSTAEGLEVLKKLDFSAIIKQAITATNNHARG